MPAIQSHEWVPMCECRNCKTTGERKSFYFCNCVDEDLDDTTIEEGLECPVCHYNDVREYNAARRIDFGEAIITGREAKLIADANYRYEAAVGDGPRKLHEMSEYEIIIEYKELYCNDEVVDIEIL